MRVYLALVKTFLWQTAQANHCMLLTGFSRSHKEPKEGKVMLRDSVTEEDGITRDSRTVQTGKKNFTARLTELRVKVCSMYGSVYLACLQCCSTRLVCINKSICWSSVVCMRVCARSVERQRGRREHAGELKILTATESSKAPSLFLCCRFLSPSLAPSCFAVNSSSSPPYSPPSPS